MSDDDDWKVVLVVVVFGLLMICGFALWYAGKLGMVIDAVCTFLVWTGGILLIGFLIFVVFGVTSNAIDWVKKVNRIFPEIERLDKELSQERLYRGHGDNQTQSAMEKIREHLDKLDTYTGLKEKELLEEAANKLAGIETF